MEMKVLDPVFSICKVRDLSQIPLEDEFCFLAKTDEELSLICITAHAPLNCIEREDGWRAFRIQGQLDFSLVGILSRISAILAENRIGIFAVSTYNTDYILVRAGELERAMTALGDGGYQLTLGTGNQGVFEK